MALTAVSCRSTNQFLKAKPARLSPFIEHPYALKPDRERAPFHRVWSSPDLAARQRAAQKTEIYIAPVTLKYLRPIAKNLPRKEVDQGITKRREKEMATRLRTEFALAFIRAEKPRYFVAQKPNEGSVTLELALVELNPTSPSGNAVKTGLKFVIGPLAGIGSIFTKGNVAIEGKVRNSATNELIYQFTDNEADRMTLYSRRDFLPYGHAVYAMVEWAAQFELLTRTGNDRRVEETLVFTLRP